MLFRLLFFTLTWGFIVSANASEYESMQTVFSKLPSEFLQLTEEHDLPAQLGVIHWIMGQEWLKYTPRGDARASQACQWTNTAHSSLREFHQKLNEYMHRCLSEVESPTNLVSSTYLGTALRYSPRENPYGRHVLFQLPGGVRLKGYLAMHDDKPRPLLLFRLGIFSNTEDFFPERYLLMQMFEQGPFNVLMLESMTGVEFSERNDVWGFAGMDEGVQNELIIQHLNQKSEPLSHFVSEIHLLATSLGGHSIWFTNLFEKKHRIVKSALALCPLMNLRDTLDFHLVQGVGESYIEKAARQYLKKFRDRYAELQGDQFIENYLHLLAEKYRGPVSDSLQISWPSELALKKKNFFKGNDFIEAYHDVLTPTMILATAKDPLVPYPFNIGRLIRGDYTFPRSEVEAHIFEDGYHCSFPSFFDWHESAALFQSYFLNFSTARFQERSLQVRLNDSSWNFIQANGLHPRYDVDFSEEGTDAILTIHWQKEKSSWAQSFFAPKDLVKIHLPEFDFSRHAAVENQTEKNLYARWIRQNVSPSITRQKQNIELKWKVLQ